MATGLNGRVHEGLEGLTSGYFAVVIATSIISVRMKLGASLLRDENVRTIRSVRST